MAAGAWINESKLSQQVDKQHTVSGQTSNKLHNPPTFVLEDLLQVTKLFNGHSVSAQKLVNKQDDIATVQLSVMQIRTTLIMESYSSESS